MFLLPHQEIAPILPRVARDFGTTLDAQRARGFEIDKIRGGILSKIARLAPMVVPVVIGSIVEAEDIISAMELRCFGVGKRTWFTKLHARPLDRTIITLMYHWLFCYNSSQYTRQYLYSRTIARFTYPGYTAFLALIRTITSAFPVPLNAPHTCR
jgi:Cobalt transport protein